MNQRTDIVLSCPGGKCPIKKSCATHGREGTMMPHEPFQQTGMSVRCNYFELKKSGYDMAAKAIAEANKTTEEKKVAEESVRQDAAPATEVVQNTGGKVTQGSLL